MKLACRRIGRFGHKHAIFSSMTHLEGRTHEGREVNIQLLYYMIFHVYVLIVRYMSYTADRVFDQQGKVNIKIYNVPYTRSDCTRNPCAVLNMSDVRLWMKTAAKSGNICTENNRDVENVEGEGTAK